MGRFLLWACITWASVCGAMTKKVLVIGIDGLRPDAMEKARTPNIQWLIARGYYSNRAQCEDLTFSGPNWASILHGIHRDKHNVTTNDYEGNRLSQYPDFLALVERHNPALVTGRFSTWEELHKNQPTGADVNVFYDYAKEQGDTVVARELARWITERHPQYKGSPDVAFIYLTDVDSTGHQFGFHPSVPQYLDEIERADEKVGWLLEAIRARPQYANEEWLIILTSDHGGAIDGIHHGNTPEKRTIPFIVSGPRAIRTPTWRAPRNVDVTKTVLHYLSIPFPESLDGTVVGLLPLEAKPHGFGRNLLVNGDAEIDRGFANDEIDQAVSGWNDPGPSQFTIVPYGSYLFPSLTDPGPALRGRNFFSGGQAPTSRLAQNVDLSWLNGQPALFKLSAALGGFQDQHDEIRVIVQMRDERRETLTTIELGPVTPAERGNKTGLIMRERSGIVPQGTQSAHVTLEAQRKMGRSNDGYADNLIFELQP